jgi:hypothetical protein
MITMACHCTGCQRMTASAFSLSALVPGSAFAVTAGEPVIGGLHGSPRHFFCPYCMSWLFSRIDAAGDLVNVRTPMLDDMSGLDPFMETMTAEKLPWAVTPARRSFKGFPDTSEYPALMAEFAARADAV